MSVSSPEAGEFAAKNRINAEFAFTTLQIASKAADFIGTNAMNMAGSQSQSRSSTELACIVQIAMMKRRMI
jgi:hypothetical protein